MFRSPPNALQQQGNSAEKGDGSFKPRRTIELQIETGASNDDDLVRNRSHDTETTVSGSANSTSGIYSVELLRDIYPSIDELSESECGESEEGNDGETAVHVNYANNGSSATKTEKVAKETPLSITSPNIYGPSGNPFKISSSWDEDRPFDEESLRAKSEKLSDKGGNNMYSKGLPATEEYILPPVDGHDKVIGISSYYEKPYNVVKNSSKNTTVTVPIVHILPSNVRRSDDESFATKSMSSSKEAGQNESKRHRVSRKYCFIGCICIILLLAAAIAVGVIESRSRASKAPSENETTGSSLNSTSISSAQEESDTTNSTVMANQSDVEVTEPATSTFDSGASTPNDEIQDLPTKPAEEPVLSPETTLSPPEIVQEERPVETVSETSPWADVVGSTLPPTKSSTEPRSWGTIITYADPVPSDFFPLGHCMGDCDKDADCAEGLVCFQRGPNDPIPFCYGGETDFTRTDYCTYPSSDQSAVGPENPSPPEPKECVSTVSVVQDCLFLTENVIVVDFENCDPQDGDWVGVYPDGTAFFDGSSSSEYIRDDWIEWAYTCGDIACEESPTSYSFAFPMNDNPAFDLASLRVYLLRNTQDGPPYEIVVKSESFPSTRSCEAN